MTYEGMALSDMEMLNVMSVARETGALVMVHAENYDAIRFLTDRLERAGKTAPRYHATSRPIPVERLFDVIDGMPMRQQEIRRKVGVR